MVAISNPAITLGVFLIGWMSGKDVTMYMVFRTIGAVAGAVTLYASCIYRARDESTATCLNSFSIGMM